MARPAAGSNENAPPTTCRFLISGLRAGSKTSDGEYHVDLVRHQHGLYDIVVQVFEEMNREKLTSDSIYKHLWNFMWNKYVYMNGWREGPAWTQREMGASNRHIDEVEPRLLANLDLQVGQTGSFQGQSAQFSVTLVDMAEVDASSLDTYPTISKVPQNFSTKLEADWLSDAEKQQCDVLAEAWYQYYNGANAWKRKRDYNPEGPRYELKKPTFPEWRADEIMLMGLLINANCKFKKSWTSILRYAFVDRRESACSGMFYKLKGNEYYRIEHCGMGISADKLILKAKTMAKGRVRDHLASGAPEKKENPEIAAERILRQRGVIDDDTNPYVRRYRIADYISTGYIPSPRPALPSSDIVGSSDPFGLPQSASCCN